jgi:hypothetical protein
MYKKVNNLDKISLYFPLDENSSADLKIDFFSKIDAFCHFSVDYRVSQFYIVQCPKQIDGQRSFINGD